jgi:putative MATE family efflux protein
MMIALMVNVINIGGNAIFLFVFKLGVMGVALSTLISRAAAACVLVTLLVRNRRYPITLAGISKPKFVPPMVRNILNIGIPSGLESSMFQLGRLLTQRIFTVFGTTAIAANAIASVINSFSFMPGTAFGMALLTVVGQCIGAQDYEAAKKYTKKIMIYAYICIFTMSSLIFIFIEPVVSFFNLSGEAHDLVKVFLRIHCISMALGWALSFAMPNALRAAGDARYVMIIATISMWTIRVSCSYLFTFTFKMGPLGVWLAMGGDFMFRGCAYLHRWVQGKWREKKVIEDA